MLRSRGSDASESTNKYNIEDINGKDIKQESRAKLKYATYNHNRHTISWHWTIIAVAFMCLLFYSIHLIDHILPRGVTIEEANNDPKLFSAERARSSLRKLAALGPREVGSIANEKYAPEIIINEILDAMKSAHPNQKLQLFRQKGSGAYQRYEKVFSYTNVYVNIQNVIVLLEGSEDKNNILVNCHYDSFPGVDGASDDLISCGVMLEIIRVLTAGPTRLRHNIVFLFNGAEETGLQAAHMFFEHPLSKNCRAFLNLEAAGAGGRVIIFQSGPNHSWLFNYYAKYAPHPHAMVLVEEMFQGDFIPSDTDFKVFSLFGNMPGIDFAFGRYGHVYHTIYDSEVYIPLGSYQHMGDNILELLKALGHAPEIDKVEDHAEGALVYFDYLGWFMVSYSTEGAIAINIILIAINCFSIALFIGQLLKWSWLVKISNAIGKPFKVSLDDDMKENLKVSDDTNDSHLYEMPTNETMVILREFSIAIAARIIGMGLTFAIAAIMGLIINSAAVLAMPWYSNIWLLFPIYWVPCLLVFAFVPHLIDIWRTKYHNIPVLMRTHMNLVASQVPYLLVYFVLTCIGIRSAFMLIVQTIFSTFGNLLIYSTPIHRSVHKWLWVYLVCQIPSIFMNLYFVLVGYVVFSPVMARSGVVNSDFNIAIITAIFVLYAANFIVPIITLVRKSWAVFLFFVGFSIITIIIALTTDVGHPYRGPPDFPKPQRYWIMHTQRELRNDTGHIKLSESGYFVLNLDINSPRTMPTNKVRNIRLLEADCENELACGLPFYTTRSIPLSPSSSWIPASPRFEPNPTDLILNNDKRDCVGNICTFNFTLLGPDRMTLLFSPRPGASLESWNIPTDPVSTLTYKGQPLYFVHIVFGELEPYDVSLVFKVTADQLNNKPIFDIGLGTNHIHHGQYRSREFQDLLDSLPDWTHKTGWISAYKGYVY